MALLQAQSGMRTRKKVDPATIPVVSDRTASALDYLGGNNRVHVLTAMAERFATVIEKTKDPNTGAVSSHIAKSKPAAVAAIKYGLLETATLYLMQRINNEVATLYNYGAEYEYIGAPESFEADVAEMRADAGHVLSCQRMDWIACGVGTAAMLVQIIGDTLDYQPIDPDKIWIGFADTITDDTGTRPVNSRNIEDASLVVVQLNGFDDKGKARFVAYFGASEDFPQGRMVTYCANSFTQIPDIGDDSSAVEYMTDDEQPANPLTLWKQMQRDASLPEYPVIVWTGQALSTPSLITVDLGLYDQCKELDLAVSRVLLSTLKAARGVFEFHKDAGSSDVMPENIDEGVAVTEHGTGVKVHNVSGANSQYAWDVIDKIAAHTAASRAVPSYRLAISPGAMVPSGAALMMLNQPMVAYREKRWRLNASQASRMFSIEMALVSANNGAPVAQGVKELWVPRDIPVLKDDAEKRAAIKEELEMGMLSVERAGMRMYEELDSVEKARNYFDELKSETKYVPIEQQQQGFAPRVFAGRRGVE